MTYSHILDYIERNNESGEDGIYWKFCKIVGHSAVKKGDDDYMNLAYNVLVLWEIGEISTVPLSQFFEDAPYECALYAIKNNLLDEPGWKRCKRIARMRNKFKRSFDIKYLKRKATKAKIDSFKKAPKYKYGYKVPTSYEDAERLDNQNKNHLWREARATEFEKLDKCEVFKDLGDPKKGTRIPSGYRTIRIHIVYDVKNDGRHRAGVVAGGHLTPEPGPGESVYSGVVTLRGMKTVMFLAELNYLKLWNTDISSAYLEAYTTERVVIIAGPEFGERQGHIFVIWKALYGLRFSGKLFGELLFEALDELGFTPSRAEPQIWMRENDGIYKYVATYVDDLLLAMKDPDAFIKTLQGDPYNFKFKGTSEVDFHLGADYGRDPDGTLYMSPRRYIEQIGETYTRF